MASINKNLLLSLLKYNDNVIKKGDLRLLLKIFICTNKKINNYLTSLA